MSRLTQRVRLLCLSWRNLAQVLNLDWQAKTDTLIHSMNSVKLSVAQLIDLTLFLSLVRLISLGIQTFQFNLYLAWARTLFCLQCIFNLTQCPFMWKGVLGSWVVCSLRVQGFFEFSCKNICLDSSSRHSSFVVVSESTSTFQCAAK